MKEMLALVIDRATSAIVSNLNYEIGRGAHYKHVLGRAGSGYFSGGEYDEYQRKLQEYVQAKLRLHQLRKSMYYPFDSYAEREGDLQPLLDRCVELRKIIRGIRRDIPAAAWGDLAPAPTPTVHDKPLLYAMDIHDCSYQIVEFEEERDCAVQAEHWYHGMPYCRKHLTQARYDAKVERKIKQQQAKARHRAALLSGDWSIAKEEKEDPNFGYHESGFLATQEKCKIPGCLRTAAHVHNFGGVSYCEP